MKTALITGASRGIGKALVDKFSFEGWRVIYTSRDLSVNQEQQEQLSKKNLHQFFLDLSDQASIKACAQAVSDSGQSIDVLINNAGGLFDEEETSVVVDKLRQTLEVNLIGTIDFTERILPLIQTGGHIINISSTAGSLHRAGFPSASHFPLHYPSYKISKTALNMYTRVLALRMQDRHIFVNSVHPGWVQTNIGGEDAHMSAQESAEHIFKLAVNLKDTGGFWFKDQRLPW